jgi:hypothetical protein
VGLILPDTIAAETEIRLNGPVLLFALALAALMPILFSVVPALRTVRDDLEKSLRGTGKGTAGSLQHRRFHEVVTAEVALSFTLLIGAGLLIKSFVAFAKSISVSARIMC